MAEVKLVIQSSEATEEQLRELAEWFQRQLLEQNSGGGYAYSINIE